MTEKTPIDIIKTMSLDEFSQKFSEEAKEKKSDCIETILAILRVVHPLDRYENVSPPSMIAEIREKLDADPRVNPVSQPSGDGSPNFITKIQYFINGNIRCLAFESWGIMATIIRAGGWRNPDLVIFREWV